MTRIIVVPTIFLVYFSSSYFLLHNQTRVSAFTLTSPILRQQRLVVETSGALTKLFSSTEQSSKTVFVSNSTLPPGDNVGISSNLNAPVSLSSSSSSSFSAAEEAQRLLDRARKVREEIAALEGRSVEQVEEESAQKRQMKQQAEAAREVAREQRQKEIEIRDEQKDKQKGRYLITVPETVNEQIIQAKDAIERAYRDGKTRQIIRFALLEDNDKNVLLDSYDQTWPGGAQQMYRRAAGPMTRELLRILRTKNYVINNNNSNNTSSGIDNNDVLRKPPTIKSQDIWDFDGSALITSEASTGPEDDIQALVLSNTDNKYTEDIDTISNVMKKRLFILVNPFWRNIESWGFNLLAPNAKKRAQDVIFGGGGFIETYCVITKSVRGEDCVAIKAYPYDWQLYVYLESDYWPYESPQPIYLGSTSTEPKVSDYISFLDQRDEFKFNKNMRQLQRNNKQQ